MYFSCEHVLIQPVASDVFPFSLYSLIFPSELMVQGCSFNIFAVVLAEQSALGGMILRKNNIQCLYLS
jgi:hypothetical protein